SPNVQCVSTVRRTGLYSSVGRDFPRPRQGINLSIQSDNDSTRASGNGDPDIGSARPFDRECFRFAAQPEHRHRGILRPIPASGMDFARGTRTPVRIMQSNDRADAARVFRRPIQADAQAGFAADVAIEFGRAAILPDGEVESSVVVVITKRRAPTLT